MQILSDISKMKMAVGQFILNYFERIVNYFGEENHNSQRLKELRIIPARPGVFHNQLIIN